MTVYPEYMDTLAFANIKKGQLPFYILFNTIHKEFPLHHHDFMEFSLVVEGYGSQTINGAAHPLQPGTAFILLPNQMHAIFCTSDQPIRLYCCMFDIQLLFESRTDAEIGKYLMRTADIHPPYCSLDHEQSVAMKQLCTEIMEEYQSNRPFKFSGIRSKFIQTLLLYVRFHVQNYAAESLNPMNETDEGDWAIIRYVYTHFLQSLTLKDLSDRFGVSPAYISRLFKKHLGVSFTECLHMIRIRRAESLLRTTEMNIYEIAEDAGFDSLRSFSRVFKQLKGLSPSQYRHSYIDAPIV